MEPECTQRSLRTSACCAIRCGAAAPGVRGSIALLHRCFMLRKGKPGGTRAARRCTSAGLLLQQERRQRHHGTLDEHPEDRRAAIGARDVAEVAVEHVHAAERVVVPRAPGRELDDERVEQVGPVRQASQRRPRAVREETVYHREAIVVAEQRDDRPAGCPEHAPHVQVQHAGRVAPAVPPGPEVGHRHEYQEQQQPAGCGACRRARPWAPSRSAGRELAGAARRELVQQPGRGDPDQVGGGPGVRLAVGPVGVVLVVVVKDVHGQVEVDDEPGSDAEGRERQHGHDGPPERPAPVVQDEDGQADNEEDHVVPEVPRPTQAHLVRIKWQEVHCVRQLGPP
mmetsp:Transcript_51880/g.143652  ORF Transcript_51880/g.143652 Transcript_51880/m.143652 type:complete len:340 (-) Transcript_51880:518-1537(-)